MGATSFRGAIENLAVCGDVEVETLEVFRDHFPDFVDLGIGSIRGRGIDGHARPTGKGTFFAVEIEINHRNGTR